ncbi:addiction module toxin, HicA family [Natronorubrum sp. JWXQ-INN-674]|uniref:Type II toxin-antitoxin system HicA family toxin n=3 Tax=Halobacteriales TaxID=2235 RepID=A0A4S3TGV9_9EURY|nr:addiction module toxin, HicA family [Natronorubrum halalkaliphilum]THE63116.1 type II toxin-antitoxin system HicA family toxin [Salinadaptatus halalkaliphilus]
MARGTYSGDDVMTVLVNHGPFYVDRVNGDHFILRWNPPEDHDSDARTVVVPRHDEISTGTLKRIGDQAGMKDFQQFLDWLDRNL